MNFLDKFKSLPSKTRSLMSFAIILGLTIALPLFVWALVNLDFNSKEKAASGEPPIGTPINWSTASVSITADDFYIESNGKRYFEDPQYTTVNPSVILYDSDGMSTSIEVVSNQYGDTLKAQIDLKSNADKWWITKIKLFANTDSISNWSTEYHNPIAEAYLGTFYNGQGSHSIGLVNSSNGNIVASVNSVNFKIIAFYEMPTSADLMIDKITIDRVSPPTFPCESYKYTVTIKNIGSEPVFKTRVKTSFTPSTQQAINNCTEIRGYESSNAPIPAYESQLYVMPNETYEYYDYFNPTSNGAVTLSSEVDYTHTYSEQNENNNILTKTINVTKLYPDLDPTVPPLALIGDINNDGSVNVIDISIVVEYYDVNPSSFPTADVNGDGKINVVDIQMVIDNY